MFVTVVDKEVIEGGIENVLQQQFCVGVLEKERLSECYEQIGVERYVIEECINNPAFFRNNIEVYENFTFGMVSMVDMFKIDKSFEKWCLSSCISFTIMWVK